MRWAREGEARTSTERASGSVRHTTTTVRAVTTMTTRPSRAATAARWRWKTRQSRCSGRSGARRSSQTAPRLSLIADPGVDRQVHEVHREVRENDRDSHDHEDGEHDGVVVL